MKVGFRIRLAGHAGYIPTFTYIGRVCGCSALLLLAMSALFQVPGSRVPENVQQTLEASNVESVDFVGASGSDNSQAELDMLMGSRRAGLVTDWRLAGPFGTDERDFENTWNPELAELSNRSWGSQRGKSLQFADGRFVLPPSIVGRGVYYAAATAYAWYQGDWVIYFESGGRAELQLDGKIALEQQTAPDQRRQLVRVTAHLAIGSHHVLVKFLPDAAPFRVALLPFTGVSPKRRLSPMPHPESNQSFVLASRVIPAIRSGLDHYGLSTINVFKGDCRDILKPCSITDGHARKGGGFREATRAPQSVALRNKHARFSG